MAVTGLAKIGDHESMADVARLLQDEDPEVRRRAAAYMAEFNCDEALDSLSLALQDTSQV